MSKKEKNSVYKSNLSFFFQLLQGQYYEGVAASSFTILFYFGSPICLNCSQQRFDDRKTTIIIFLLFSSKIIHSNRDIHVVFTAEISQEVDKGNCW